MSSYLYALPGDVFRMIGNYLSVRYCFMCNKHFWAGDYEKYFCYTCDSCYDRTPPLYTAKHEFSLRLLCSTFYPVLERFRWHIHQAKLWDHLLFPSEMEEGRWYLFCRQ